MDSHEPEPVPHREPARIPSLAFSPEIAAAAVAFVQRHGGERWRGSSAFTFSQLGGRGASPRPRDSRAAESEARLFARALGPTPVYLRDADRTPVAIVAPITDWPYDDITSAVVSLKFGL